jgi:tRNA pseudouridine55 synthase
MVGRSLDVHLEPVKLKLLLASFVGKQEQVPPPYAAKKIGGKRMYQLARAGIGFQPRPVTVVVRRIELLTVEKDRAWLEVEAESGTYIRSLAHDVGQRLGFGAHLEELRRTRVEPFSVEQALTLEALSEPGRLEEAILGPSEALSQLPALHMGAEEAERIRHGRAVQAAQEDEASSELGAGQHCRMLGPQGVFLAVGVVDDEGRRIRPVVVLG